MSEAISGITMGGANIATGLLSKRATERAYQSQRRGLRVQTKQLKEDYDIDRVNNLVTKYDKKYLEKRLELQQEIDPELAEVRRAGKEQLRIQFQTPESSRQSTLAANKLFRENINESPEAKRLRERMTTEAHKELDLGAQLPPEFQAELVRSGLEQGSTSGIGMSRRSIGGTVSTLLGAGGVALKAGRQNQAMNLANAGQQLTDARFNILANIFPTVSSAEAQSMGRSAAAFALGNDTIPQGGLTGREVLSTDIAGREGIRSLTQTKHDMKAKNILNRARMTARMIGQAASAMTAAAGGKGSALGGMLDMGGGGGGGMMGGMMGGGGGAAAGGAAGGAGGGGGMMSMVSSLAPLLMASDRNVKTAIEPIDKKRREEILDKVINLPVSVWEYDTEDLADGAKHIGPMAQDFSEAFQVGSSDRHIHVVDANGVLLTAVQALAEKVLALETAQKD